MSALVVEDIKTVFRSFDLNRDGTIDLNELTSVLQSCDEKAGWTDGRVALLFKQMDKDCKENIQFDDFVDWIFNSPSDAVTRALEGGLRRDLQKAAKRLSASGKPAEDVHLDAFGREALCTKEDARLETLGREALLASSGRADGCSCIYVDSKTGGKVFIGGVTEACSRKTLEDHGITAVINCQGLLGKHYFEEDPAFVYLRFGPASWMVEPDVASDEGVLRFFDPVFQTIDTALADGQSVLIHCFAGIHRAGATGVASLMYLSGRNCTEALLEAQRVRPQVNPYEIESLKDLLSKLDTALYNKRLAAA